MVQGPRSLTRGDSLFDLQHPAARDDCLQEAIASSQQLFFCLNENLIQSSLFASGLQMQTSPFQWQVQLQVHV